MALPTNREEFKQYVLRRLGAPVVRINLDDAQIDDRIDDAIKYWQDYHFDGSFRVFLAHEVTDIDKQNQYLELDEKYIGVVRMFEIATMMGSQHLFSLTYQFAQSDFLASALTGSMVPYWMAMTHIELIQQVLMGRQPIRFNRHRKRLHVDMDWNRVHSGDFIIAEAYERIDPDEDPSAWSDRWLLRYATALVKKNWGESVKKYGNMPMAGGMVFNGQQIYDEATAEIEALEKSVVTDYGEPLIDFLG